MRIENHDERLVLSRNKEELMRLSKEGQTVELTLPKDANIYASAYQLYLPNKALLQAKVKEWNEEFEENEELKKTGRKRIANCAVFDSTICKQW